MVRAVFGPQNKLEQDLKKNGNKFKLNKVSVDTKIIIIIKICSIYFGTIGQK
jgi:hypothetical protein